MAGDMFATNFSIPPEIAELMKPYAPAKRVEVIEGALAGSDRTGGKLSDKDVSINRTDSGYTVTWMRVQDIEEAAMHSREGRMYSYDRDGNHVDTHVYSRLQSLLDPKMDKGDLILRQLGTLEKTT
jgi:hypothetical protein